MNRRVLLTLIALMSAGSPLSAQTETAELATTASASVVSNYMFRGVKLGGPAFQPYVEGAWGATTVGIWSSFPIDDKVPGQSDPEFDVYASHRFELNEAVSIQPGIIWYHYPRAEKSNGYYRNTVEPSLALNWVIKGVQFTPKAYYDLTLDGATYELSAAYAVPVAPLGTELSFLAQVGTFKWNDVSADAQPPVKNWGDYYLVGLTVPFQVTTNSKVSLGIAYTRGSNNYLKQGTAPKDRNASAIGRTVVTLGYVLSF